MKEDARNMNDQPDRFELFTLAAGEEKVTMEYDSRLPNTAIFHFNREDHTLGNLLAAALLQTEHVLFAAYKVPHPLVPNFILRVSTSSETGPREALESACRRVIQDLQNMAKQFTREWEIWKLTNEAAAGREDEEKIEREKKMAGARKERDRVRAAMIREEAAERALRGDVGLRGAAWDNGGSGRGGGEASPPWDGRGGRGGSDSPGRAPWDEPARSDVGDSAPWNKPIGGGGSDGGVSPAWDGGISAGITSAGGRAPWDEPAGSSSASWNDTSHSPDERSPSYEPPSSTGGQSYGGSSSRAPWDAPAGGKSPTYKLPGSGRSQSHQSGQQASSPSRAPWDTPAEESSVAPWDAPAGGRSPSYEPLGSGRSQSGQQASSSSRAPWDAPAGRRSPTYELPGSGRSQSHQSGQQASSPSRAPWDAPAEESSVAPWDAPAGGRSPTYEPPVSGRSQSYQSGEKAGPFSKAPLGQPAEETSGAPWDQSAEHSSRAPWDELTGDNDTSVLRSPSRNPERTPTSPPAKTWDTPTGEPESDGILTASNDTVGGGKGRVAAHELHTFSASSAMGASWGQDSGANESVHRDPNSEGEQAYLRRAAVVGSGTEVSRDARNEDGSTGSNEGSGGGDGNDPCDNNDSNGDGAGNEDVSPPWSGGFGGSSPAAGDSGNNAPWENY